MIFKHTHLPQASIQNKIQHTISRENPLCIIVSNSFLSSTLENSLNIKRIPFIKKMVTGLTLMQHKLPLLMYQNTILSQQQIVQFLGDLQFGQLPFQQYIQRKQICLELYNKWNNLIDQESRGVPIQKVNIIKGIKSKQDYHNHVFSGLMLLSLQIGANALQRKYDHYKRTQVNLQNMLAHDLLNTICNQCPTSMVDHILRGHFNSLLGANEMLKNMIKKQIEKVLQQNQQDKYGQVKVLTDEKIQQKAQNQNYSFNWRRFGLSFGVLSGIYYFWGGK